MEIAKAANPRSTFWENFTIVEIFKASSPTIVPEAMTAPVVSIVPPNQAPVTACDNPKAWAIKGKKPLYSFLIAQLFIVFVTLLVAYLLF